MLVMNESQTHLNRGRWMPKIFVCKYVFSCFGLYRFGCSSNWFRHKNKSAEFSDASFKLVEKYAIYKLQTYLFSNKIVCFAIFIFDDVYTQFQQRPEIESKFQHIKYHIQYFIYLFCDLWTSIFLFVNLLNRQLSFTKQHEEKIHFQTNK